MFGTSVALFGLAVLNHAYGRHKRRAKVERPLSCPPAEFFAPVDVEPSTIISRRVSEGCMHMHVRQSRATVYLHCSNPILWHRTGYKYRYRFDEIDVAGAGAPNIELVANNAAKNVATFVTEKMSEPLPLAVDEMWNRPDVVPSRIISRRINEGVIHIYFKDGVARPVLHVGSARLRKKLGCYRYRFSELQVSDDDVESKADCIREDVIGFVKESLKRSTTSEVAVPVVVGQRIAQKSVAETQSIVEDVPAPIDVKVIDSLPESPAVVDPVVTNVPRRARTTKGCVLVDFGYKPFPYAKEGQRAPNVFFATLEKNGTEFTVWGNDLRRAILDAGAEKGSTIDFVDLGKGTTIAGDGSTNVKHLYEMTVVQL